MPLSESNTSSPEIYSTTFTLHDRTTGELRQITRLIDFDDPNLSSGEIFAISTNFKGDSNQFNAFVKEKTGSRQYNLGVYVTRRGDEILDQNPDFAREVYSQVDMSRAVLIEGKLEEEFRRTDSRGGVYALQEDLNKRSPFNLYDFPQTQRSQQSE